MNVVIGATGFLGSHLLCHLVQSGDKIRALYHNEQSLAKTEPFPAYYNLPHQTFAEKIEWYKVDILDIESITSALQGADIVYNCSGYVSFNKTDKDKMIAVNVKGTANIVNACLENNCKKLIHVSSIAALGETNTSDPITEETPWLRSATDSWYSITKFYAETEVWRGIAEGLSSIIVNPSVILGPGNWNEGSPKLFQTVDNGLRYYTKGIVGYVDVRDVCSAMILLAQSSIENEKFILSGSNQSYEALFQTIAKAIGKPLPNRNAGLYILALAWRLDKLRSLLFGKEQIITQNTARTALKKNWYTSQKLQTTISFQYRSFQETIQFAANCFLSREKH